MKKSETKKSMGSTSIEVIVAIGVVVGLAGFVPPMIASSKVREADRSELSELHQLAIAQALYTGETGGIPMSTLTLVEGGYVSSNLCSSPVDLTPDGMANAITDDLGSRSQHYLKLGTSYRNSYVGLREFDFPKSWMDQYVKTLSGGGWLASLGASKKFNEDGHLVWSSDTYRRLMLDGSVKTCHHQPVTLKVGKETMRADHSLFLFVDGTTEWKTSFISGSL
jgi:hypothetical protein